jgi:hypothetical protein
VSDKKLWAYSLSSDRTLPQLAVKVKRFMPRGNSSIDHENAAGKEKTCKLRRIEAAEKIRQ